MVSKLGGLDLTLPQGAHPLSPLIWTKVMPHGRGFENSAKFTVVKCVS